MPGQPGRRTATWLPVLIIAITLVSLGIGGVTLAYIETSSIESAGEGLALAAVDIAGRLDLLMTERHGDIQMLARAPVFQGRDVAAMAAHLQAVQEAYPVYLWLGATDKAGLVTAATGDAMVGTDRSRTAWFQAVRGGGGIHIGEAEVSEDTDGVVAISFTAPITGAQGEFLGAVTARVGLPVLEDVFAQTALALQAQHGSVTRVEYQFLDRTGAVIADSILREEGHVNLKLLGLPSAMRFDKAPPGYVEETHYRRAVSVITGYAQTKGALSWGVLVRMDRSDVLVPIRTVLRNVGAAGAVVWLPMFVLLLWTGDRMKRAWMRATEQEEWLATTLDNVSDAVIATDRKGCVVVMNPLAAYLTGWNPTEAQGASLKDVFKMVTEGTRQPVGNCMAKVPCAEGSVAPATQGLLLARDGSELPIESSGAPIKNARGRVRGIVLTFRDVAARRRMETRQAAQLSVSLALAESDRLAKAAPRLLQAICETAGWEVGMIWLVESVSQMLRCETVWHLPSVQADAFVGLSRASTFPAGVGLPGRVWMSGKPAWITDVLKDQNFPRVSAAAQAGLHAGFAFPIKGGARIHGVVEFFSRKVRPLDADLLDMMADVGLKIGQFVERQEVIEAAKASEERFRLGIDHATDAIIYVDGQGIIRWANQRTLMMTGQSMEELIGGSLMKAFANQPMAKSKLAAIGLGRPVPPFTEFEVFLRDGTSRWLEVTSTQVKERVENAEIAGWLLVARDRTEHKQAERHLRQAEKMASLGMLLDGIAHELNNPLFMISGNAQLASEEVKLGRYEGLADELAAIQDAAARAAKIVQRTLAVSRSTAERREWCQVPTLLQQVLDLTANDLATHQIRVCRNIPADLPLVNVNPNELTQVFLGLIANARDAMDSAHGQGTLTVSAARVPDSESAASAEERHGEGEQERPGETERPASVAEACWIEVRIQDDGPGIASEHQAQIFEPFSTTKPARQATGLGLPIAQRIVNELGGLLTLESVPGQGATFIVRLPAIENLAQEPPRQAADAITPDPCKEPALVEQAPPYVQQ